MKPLKVGVVSIGGAGRAHIARFNKNPKSCIRAVFDPNEKRLGDFLWVRKKGGYVTTEYEKIINDEEVDIISICSPDYTHFDYANAAIKAGKHVLIEKPMVTSLEQCEKLQVTAHNSDKVFGVHHQMRYVPAFVQARELVLNGEIGIPVIAEADYVHDMRERATLYDNWRVNSKHPQKVVLGASSHTIDLLRWMLDDEVVEVFSYASHIGWPEYPDDDTVVTMLKFSRGAIGKVMSTISCRRPQLNSLALYGTEGNIIDNLLIDKQGLKRFIYNYKNSSWKHKILDQILMRSKSVLNYPFSMYEHEIACQSLIEEFLSCIVDGQKFSIDFCEGAYTAQLCLAAIESYEKRRPIQVKRLF